MNLLKDMPKDSGHYIASGISKVLAVLRNPMDPAVVMYEGFNGFAELTSQEGIFHFWIGMQPFVVLHAAHTIESPRIRRNALARKCVFTIFVYCFRLFFIKPLLTSTVNISKTGHYQFLGPVLGEGLLTSTGNKWRSRRKLLTPAFHFRVLDSCVGIFNEQTRVLVQKIRDSSHLDFVDLFPMMTHFTLDVLCESSMGIQLALRNMLSWISLFDQYLFLYLSATKVIRKRKEILRQEKNGDKKDQTSKFSKAFLDVLLRHHLQDSTLSEDDIMEEVNTFLFAGHETTAVGLTYLLYILGLHQDVQDKVVDEINSIFQGNLECDVTREDASLMKYLECVIKESQRIFTILPIYGRKIEEDFQVGKYVVPRGSTCVILGQILHKDPRYFPDPNVFDPDRFLPENSKGRHPYAFLPFSAGPRNCVGQKFAMTEEKVVVATVLRHFCITSLDHRDQLILAPQPILHPRSVFGGIRVKFTPRRTLQLHNA
nr:cytochrome P450 4c3-like [Dermacentor andersoni]